LTLAGYQIRRRKRKGAMEGRGGHSKGGWTRNSVKTAKKQNG